MNCPHCVEKDSRILALEEEVRSYRNLIEGTQDAAAVRIIAAGLEIRPKVARLLYYLFLAKGLFVDAEVLTEALWPDSNADRLTSSIRVAVHRLREAIGEENIITKVGAYALTQEGLKIVGKLLPAEMLKAKE